MKSIGKKISLCSVILVGVSLLVLGIFSCVMAYVSAKNMAEDNMREMVSTAANRTTWELSAYSNIAQTMGSIQRLSNPDVSDEDKQALLDNFTAQFGLQRCNIIDAEGIGLNGTAYDDRAYFQAAMRGETAFSEPLISRTTGEMTVIIAAPLWQGGNAYSQAAGCVYVVPDEEFLNDIVRDIHISDNSAAYIIDSKGNTIADFDIETVKNGQNIELLAETDANFAGVAEVHKLMRNGQTGFWSGKCFGDTIFMAYTPIEGTNGWSLAVYCPAGDFMDGTYKSIIFTIFMLVIGIVIASFIAIKLGSSIGKPISICTDRIIKLADGDLTTPVQSIKRDDEVGHLMRAMHTVVGNLNGIIGDIGRILEALAGGDLGVDTEEGKLLYAGDFERLQTYAQHITEKLNSVMVDINIAADQVATGAGYVSDGAQNLSRGAIDQNSSIEDLANSIYMISEKITLNSQNCIEARSMVNETAEFVAHANSAMSRLTMAMNEINNASNQISKIIKTIDDIAFETNILALNAAVEAAGAGEAGKGFSVVAGEVRALAIKSSDAASETTALIQQSIEAVRNGTDIAAETASTMQSVGERATSVENIVNEIASSSEQQAEMITQINNGVEQISRVIQENSATAEESAASAEELSSQAETLKSLIGSFKLRV